MITHSVEYLARGLVDRQGRLVEAGEPLASLQLACGGNLGGPLAIPELRAIAVKAGRLGLRLSRPFAALAAEDRIGGWVDAIPVQDGDGGCELGIASWHAEPIAMSDEDGQLARLRRELNRALPEFCARLDPRQAVLTVEASAPDAKTLRRMESRKIAIVRLSGGSDSRKGSTPRKRATALV